MSESPARREFLAKGLALSATCLFAGPSLPCCLLRALTDESARKEAEKPEDLERWAYCGCNCQACYVLKATRANDLATKKQIADGWNRRFGTSIKPEEVACDGCRSTTGRLGYHCGEVCDVRKCGLSRGVKSCAVCADFPTCDKELWKQWTAMHQLTSERWQRIHQSAAS